MKITPAKVLKAAKAVAHKHGFHDPESAFWQCNLFTNSIVKVAKLFGLDDFDIVMVEAQWQTPSGDVIEGDVHKHVLLQYQGRYYDYTIRQINARAKFPYVSRRLPSYYEYLSTVDIESLESEREREYINDLVEEIDPSYEVSYPMSNPRKHNPSENDYYFEFEQGMTITDVINEWRFKGRKAYDAFIHGEIKTSELMLYREYQRPLRDDLVESMSKGYDRNNPIIVIVCHKGRREAYVAEGNHRIVAAKHLGIDELPVRFVFWTRDNL